MNIAEAIPESSAVRKQPYLSPNPHPKVLFVSRTLAVPNYHGGCVYADAVLRYLRRQGCEILYVWLADLPSPTKPLMRAPIIGSHVKRLFVPNALIIRGWMWPRPFASWLRLPWYLLLKLSARLQPKPTARVPNLQPQKSPLATPRETGYLRDLVKREAPDAVLIDNTELANILETNGPNPINAPLKLVLTHNLIHRRVTAYQSTGTALDFYPLSRGQETLLLENADIVVAIQRTEAAEFRAMLPHKQIVEAPMPATLMPLPAERQRAGRCLFVGGATQHNIDGLRWFLDEVWPLLLNTVPEATLAVGGTVGDHFNDLYPRCKFHGSVKDVIPLYEEAAVCVVPLRTGSGLKIKLVEAMAYCRAVVSTSVGAEGFSDFENGALFPVADSSSDFARRIADLLTNDILRQQCVAAQTAWILRNLTADDAFGPLWQAIHCRAAIRADSLVA